ncbi:ATP-binding cassette transporter snq2 [Elasticomyces elasticus]|uniref:ATP-binding cassette transporter snq2 n=1 Tax=Exophiala sideris TaxID=1016849 RepID=A0ABR0J1F6_9EURO|nr:ATP-binding cassette transporter snq2 [Elasticomyces elasticus]KAK5024309.1 ATP-binding cassette transporter snq2 [Exophiala sideris]KAK5054042.1 ATP-binding cassette transporter snq2 [Exophiala sideris]
MYSVPTGKMFIDRARGSDVAQAPLHNSSSPSARGRQSDDDNTLARAADEAPNGMWGERDGESCTPDVQAAMHEYEEIRRELSYLSTTPSRKSTAIPHRPGLLHEQTAANVTGWKSDPAQRGPLLVAKPPGADKSIQTGRESGKQSIRSELDGESIDEEFSFGDFLEIPFFGNHTEGQSLKKVGIVYKNLTVYGAGASATSVKTLPSAVLGTFGPDLYRLLSSFLPRLPSVGTAKTERRIINNFTGVVRPGEILLVLGRRGSGCSTLLKALANKREEYTSLTGLVHYGGISAEEQLKYYKGEVTYNAEDDQHFPTLTVEQTLTFALTNKCKKNAKRNIPIITNGLLKIFGISHIRHTIVGDAFIRGISGGERKRVSIAETLATESKVMAWDNSTRGLDASTAYDFAKSLRIMTDISHRTNIVTLYQAGEGIYDLVDKVLVIDDGRMVYQGPMNEAKAYFEGLGYYCPERQTTPDFLTSCTDPAERRFRAGFETTTPRGAVELEKAFYNSDSYKNVLKEVQDYESVLKGEKYLATHKTGQPGDGGRSKKLRKSSSYTTSFVSQVLACTKREFWLVLGDRAGLYSRAFIIISITLIVASLYYDPPDDTQGWMQLGELMKAVSGRTVISRHHDYALYRRSAVVIAQILKDLPLLLGEVLVFSLPMYFMAGLYLEASKFFTYVLIVYLTTINVTALYRMFAALSPTVDDAVRFSGTALNVLIIFTGYLISKSQLLATRVWFGWLFWVNPLSYSFEGLMASEFHGRVMNCDELQKVPNGSGYDDGAYQGCSATGSTFGNLQVTGPEYLEAAFQFSYSHLWRNVGICR